MGQAHSQLAHEILNPTAYALTNTEILLEQPSLNADQLESLETIKNGLIRINSIVRSSLNLAIKKSDMEKSNLKDIVAGVVAMVRTMTSFDLKHSLQTPFPSDTLKGSAVEWNQIFTNIFLNSIQAMQKAGSKTGTISTLIDYHEGAGWSLIIKDDGPGLDPKFDIKTIAEPFYSANNGKTTGLGLTVLNEIVSQMDGTIKYGTSPKGFVVIIKVPSQIIELA